jgi:hypothetical protein
MFGLWISILEVIPEKGKGSFFLTIVLWSRTPDKSKCRECAAGGHFPSVSQAGQIKPRFLAVNISTQRVRHREKIPTPRQSQKRMTRLG